MSKVIQIAVKQETKYLGGALFALCDDGTIWIMDYGTMSPWQMIKSIPSQSGQSCYSDTPKQ